MSTKKTNNQNHKFSEIPRADIQRSSFNRSCGLKTTFDAGYLVPIFVDEALPGDTMTMKMSVFGRLATPLHPVMDNLYLDTFFFAVPCRLLWGNWAKFNGAQTDPGDSTDFLVPQVEHVLAIGNSTLYDYLGLPTGEANVDHSALFPRAYNLIWNEWFRSEDLQDSVAINYDDGPDGVGDYNLLKRGKRHDYFTSCLPWPQKGTAVQLPLGVSAPVVMGASVMDITSQGDGKPTFEINATGNHKLHSKTSPSTDTTWTGSPTANADASWLQPQLEVNLFGALGQADLTSATSATINEIRQAFQIQRLYERDARGGTRYTEILRSHFGVTSSDQRLQRPEFLGGGNTNIMVNPVAQTGQTDTTPQGNLAAYGVAASTGHGFSKSFTEHCVIIGLASVRADLNYQQGLERMFSRRTRWDFFWPALAHLGEQAVLNQEIMYTNDPADILTFGYQERFAEYRYKPSRCTGQMRSNAGTPLDTWHLAQDFAVLPTLSADFIEEDPPIDRIIAVPSEPHMLLDVFFDYKCVRPMPTYSVPGMIDRF